MSRWLSQVVVGEVQQDAPHLSVRRGGLHLQPCRFQLSQVTFGATRDTGPVLVPGSFGSFGILSALGLPTRLMLLPPSTIAHCHCHRHHRPSHLSRLSPKLSPCHRPHHLPKLLIHAHALGHGHVRVLDQHPSPNPLVLSRKQLHPQLIPVSACHPRDPIQALPHPPVRFPLVQSTETQQSSSRCGGTSPRSLSTLNYWLSKAKQGLHRTTQTRPRTARAEVVLRMGRATYLLGCYRNPWTTYRLIRFLKVKMAPLS